MTCPTCGAEAIPVLYGLPTYDAQVAAGDGRIKLGGCVLMDDGTDVQWQCTADEGHQWTSGRPDDPNWVHALEEAMDRQ
jgi:hypothetical protein